jgi:hypothetical protein
MSRLYSQRNRDKQKCIIEELHQSKALLEKEKAGLLQQHQQLQSQLRAAQTDNQRMKEWKLAQRFSSASESHRRIVDAFLGEGFGNAPPESWIYLGPSSKHTGVITDNTNTNTNAQKSQMATSKLSQQLPPPPLPLSSLMNDAESFRLPFGTDRARTIMSSSLDVSPHISQMQHYQRMEIYHEWQMHQQLQRRIASHSLDLHSNAKAKNNSSPSHSSDSEARRNDYSIGSHGTDKRVSGR